tara:strand:+ start:4496 stop:4651 length:156 start_codon:yes stop_codon:yes gene_type:complete
MLKNKIQEISIVTNILLHVMIQAPKEPSLYPKKDRLKKENSGKIITDNSIN